MANELDPHANHTPEQIGELQEAYGHILDAIAHIDAEILRPFDDPDVEHVVRHLREARLWLAEVLLNAGHEPETGESTDGELEPEEKSTPPIH